MLRRQIPSTNSLFTFEAVARLESFSAAARELNVTQPAVSRSVAALESHLGYDLFERHGRWIKLTADGDKLYRATSTAFNSVSDSIREIAKHRESLEVVTLSMSPAATNHWFVPRLDAFRDAFPKTQLRFVQHSDTIEPVSHEVDLSVRLSSPQEADLHRWPFADERIMALCAPQYRTRFGPLDALRQDKHLFIEWENPRYGFDEFFHATGMTHIDKSSLTVFANYASVLNAAIEGQGITLAWTKDAVRLILDGKLVPALPQVVKTGRRFHVLASNLNPMRPIVENIRDWLIAEMRKDEKRLPAVLAADQKHVRAQPTNLVEIVS